jgi:hypothetical protein
MTGDNKAVGAKFGIAFAGKWVWGMKDYIDRGFMKLFDPNYLFNDFANKGCAEPLERNELFENELAEEKVFTDKIKTEVASFNHKVAAEWLAVDEEYDDWFKQLYILDRMGKEE